MKWDDYKIFLPLYREGTLRAQPAPPAASYPTVSSAASGLMISALRQACSHAMSGRVATPCTMIPESDTLPKPSIGAHEYWA